MRHVDLEKKTFTWNSHPYKSVYTFNNTNHAPSKLFRPFGEKVDLELIVSSGWSKEDFLDAIKCWKSYNYTRKAELIALMDWEQNLDKYLDGVIIKSIIE